LEDAALRAVCAALADIRGLFKQKADHAIERHTFH